MQPPDSGARIGFPIATKLGKYQSLVVAVIASLILVLASVPVAPLALR